MANEKKAFIMYMDWARIIANIPEEQAGEIIKAVCCKELGIDYEISDPVAAGIFISIAHKLDDDDRSYKEKCNKNRTIAKEREKKKHERLTDEHECSTDEHERSTNEHERARTCSKNKNKNDNDNDSPTENITRAREDHSEYAAKIEQIIEHLNSVTGSRYRPTKDIADLIVERLDDGFTVDDFKTVIDKKFRHWSQDPKFKHYLRPSTLFGSKFQDYLNESADRIPEKRENARSGTTDDVVVLQEATQADIDRISRAMRKRGTA